ncbi:MAG: PAS domain-containing sensor histidine kinase [Syntrophorhabdales bacterium]|jgi:PAS domain S-box-containing protein
MRGNPIHNPGVLQVILDSLPYALYLLNDRREVLWANDRAARVSGRSYPLKRGGSCCYKEMLKRQKPCDDCPAIRSFKSGAVESAELRSGREDGQAYSLVTSVPVAEWVCGSAPLVIEMIQDIRESKEVEEKLRSISELNSAIVENAPVAIFTIDESGKFLSVNPALAELSGLGPEAPAKLLNFNWLKNDYTIKCGLADYIRKGLNGEAFELWDFPFATYRGKSQYLHFRGVPLRTKDGHVEGLLCIIDETTERVRISAQLMQEGKMSAVGRLARAIAHELNNPLATLVIHSELACDLVHGAGNGITDADIKELCGYMEVVEKQAFRCKEIIKDLFDLLWSEGPGGGHTDVNTLLDEVIETQDLGGRDLKVSRDFSPRLPPAKGHSNALRRVFANIMQNALDAMKAQTRAEVWIRTSLADSCVAVEIEDNGSGIPEVIADHIFEPFFTTKKSTRGMGLGLTICDDIMRKMGGNIEMRRGQAGGSLFRVTIPADGIGG